MKVKKVKKVKAPKTKSLIGSQLNEREKTFIQEYMVDKNKKSAAIRAGYSPNMAAQEGHKLMLKPKIRDAVDKQLLAQQTRLQLTADQVVGELALIAFSDVRALFGDDGLMLNISRLDKKITTAIAGLQTVEMYAGQGDKRVVGHTLKIKLWDKVKALELLGKHFKMFTDVVETRDGTFLQKLEAARKRKEKALGGD